MKTMAIALSDEILSQKVEVSIGELVKLVDERRACEEYASSLEQLVEGMKEYARESDYFFERDFVKEYLGLNLEECKWSSEYKKAHE